MDEMQRDEQPAGEGGATAPGMAPADPRQRGEDYNTPLILIYGMLFAVIVFVSIVALSGLFHQMQGAEQRGKNEAAAPQELTDLRNAQQQKLESYSWVDARHGVAGIPIERAMQLVIAELAAPPAAAPEQPIENETHAPN
jgi:hypothetical protein